MRVAGIRPVPTIQIAIGNLDGCSLKGSRSLAGSSATLSVSVRACDGSVHFEVGPKIALKSACRRREMSADESPRSDRSPKAAKVRNEPVTLQTRMQDIRSRIPSRWA
jgi:hypothetical protein